MRVGYLGPPGTYTHEALLARFADGSGAEAVACATIHDVVAGVQAGTVEQGMVPIENSLEGSVNATLDALAFASEDVVIVGELVLGIHHCLIARPDVAVEEVAYVASHPQALAQCAGFLRRALPGASVRAAASTAEAVRGVLADRASGEDRAIGAAIGPRSAAERYGGAVLAADVEDVVGNQTRFAELARRDGAAATGSGAGAAGWRTAVAFWPRESDYPGWLVTCLAEFARRGVNLSRIESRPRKVGLGEYVFFVDLDGGLGDPAVAAGLDGVSEHVAQLRVLGSFPTA